jgi:hypothetical protein
MPATLVRGVLTLQSPSQTDPALRLVQSDAGQENALLEVIWSDGSVIAVIDADGVLQGGTSTVDVVDTMVDVLGQGAVLSEPNLSTRLDNLEAKPIRTVTGSALLLSSDSNGIVVVDSPTSALIGIGDDSLLAIPVGSQVEVVWWGAGGVSLGAVDPNLTSVNARGGVLTINKRYGSVRARKLGVNSWLLIGDVGAPDVIVPPRRVAAISAIPSSSP